MDGQSYSRPPGLGPVMDHPLLTADEQVAVENAAELWNLLVRIVRGLDADGVALPDQQRDQGVADADLAELIAHVHAIQHAVLTNAAARAYPHMIRRLGARLPTPEED